MPTLEETLQFAAQAHAGQKDRSGAPYILHPLRMLTRMKSEQEMIVAALHDVVEDTPYTLDDLRRRGYPEEIVVAVDHLTRREAESYAAFVERTQENPLARRVKLADLEDNMNPQRLPTLAAKDLARMERYQRAWLALTAAETQTPAGEPVTLALETIQHALGLQLLDMEGGYFAESYRAAETIPPEALPERYGAPRCLSTAIYYLLTPDSFSALHRLQSDEIFHFYLGDAVEMLQLHPDGSGKTVTLGTNLLSGMRPQVVAPRGVWQGTRLKPGGRFALLGTTVAPGFDYADYEHGSREALTQAYPQFAAQIAAYTR